MSAVDVVVPCYNYGRYLKGCVDGVLSQRDVDVRVLIIDDASTDDTPAVGEALAREDLRVLFRRHQQNLGHIKTFNEGILDWASAPYTLLLSADDALTAGSLARSTRVLDDHPEVGMVYGIALVIEDDSEKTHSIDAVVPTHQIISGQYFLRQACERGNPAASPTVVVRTSLQQRLGGHRAYLPHSCDMEMWMRFATQGSVGIIGDIQAYYRQHGANMNLQYCNRTLADSRQRMDASRDVFEKWGAAFPAFGTWMNLQRRRLCDDAYWSAGQALQDGDQQGVALCLAFAREYDPAPWRSAAFWRFRVKALMGRRLWHNLGPGMQRIRGTANVEPYQGAKKFGWWPDLTTS